MASGSVAGASALGRPHHAQGVRGAHVRRLRGQAPWRLRGLQGRARQWQEAGWSWVGRIRGRGAVGGQAKRESKDLGLVDVVPILEQQLPEAAGRRVEVALRGQERRSETPPSTPSYSSTQGSRAPPCPLGHKTTKAGSSFTPGWPHLPVPTSRRGASQPKDQSRLSRAKRWGSGYPRGSWSLDGPWAP